MRRIVDDAQLNAYEVEGYAAVFCGHTGGHRL